MNRSFHIEVNNSKTSETAQTDKGIILSEGKDFFVDQIKNGKPLISLIIPVLQEEKILESTLSVFSDELRKRYSVEMIVSDGGSTDRTVDIARKYADKIIIHEKQIPQTIAEGRNCGAEVAEGEILVFINGDTVPENPNYFFDFISVWGQKNGSFCDCGAIATAVTAPISEMRLRDKLFYSAHNFYVKSLNSLGIGMARGECHIVKTDLFRMAGGYNNDIIAGEDFDLYRRLARICKISYVKELRVVESPRRFIKDGYTKTLLRWLVNSFSVMLFGKSYSGKWEAVR